MLNEIMKGFFATMLTSQSFHLKATMSHQLDSCRIAKDFHKCINL